MTIQQQIWTFIHHESGVTRKAIKSQFSDFDMRQISNAIARLLEKSHIIRTDEGTYYTDKPLQSSDVDDNQEASAEDEKNFEKLVESLPSMALSQTEQDENQLAKCRRALQQSIKHYEDIERQKASVIELNQGLIEENKALSCKINELHNRIDGLNNEISNLELTLHHQRANATTLEEFTDKEIAKYEGIIKDLTAPVAGDLPLTLDSFLELVNQLPEHASIVFTKNFVPFVKLEDAKVEIPSGQWSEVIRAVSIFENNRIYD
jgi:hypothetical protein